MILELIEELDIENPSKHRMVFLVTANGNLYDCKNIGRTFSLKQLIRFPFFPLSKGDYVVIYFIKGKQKTEKFSDGICHFFYCEEDYFGQ